MVERAINLQKKTLLLPQILYHFCVCFFSLLLTILSHLQQMSLSISLILFLIALLMVLALPSQTIAIAIVIALFLSFFSLFLSLNYLNNFKWHPYLFFYFQTFIRFDSHSFSLCLFSVLYVLFLYNRGVNYFLRFEICLTHNYFSV